MWIRYNFKSKLGVDKHLKKNEGDKFTLDFDSYDKYSALISCTICVNCVKFGCTNQNSWWIHHRTKKKGKT